MKELELNSLIYKENDLQTPYKVENVKTKTHYYLEKYRTLEKLCKIPKRKYKAKLHQTKTSRVFREKYLQELPTDEELLLLKQKLKRVTDLNLENYIIQYWHQGNTLDKANASGKPWGIYHKISVDSVERYYSGKHIIFDWDNLLQIVNFPIEIKEKLENKRRIAMLSDIVRTAILFCYGGTWLDFTMLLLDKIPQSYLERDLTFYYRHGFLHLDFLQLKNVQRLFVAHSPYYFSWDPSFEVNMLSSFIHAKEGQRYLGLLLKIMLDFVKNEVPRAHEYLSYQILADLLIRQPEFSDFRMNLSTKLPSDACAHLMQVFDYMKFDEKVYTEICNRYPLQKLNGGCDLIKGSLFYESLKKQGYIV